MFSVGRVCIKIAGRDAGKKCVIVKHLEGKLYLVDGETRRRKCNTLHLEPLNEVLDIKENASHEEIMKALGLEHVAKKSKAKTEKPLPVRNAVEKKKAKPVVEKKPKKTAAKKESKKAAK
jgi:large subunit ribosomal protein L14e